MTDTSQVGRAIVEFEGRGQPVPLCTSGWLRRFEQRYAPSCERNIITWLVGFPDESVAELRDLCSMRSPFSIFDDISKWKEDVARPVLILVNGGTKLPERFWGLCQNRGSLVRGVVVISDSAMAREVSAINVPFPVLLIDDFESFVRVIDVCMAPWDDAEYAEGGKLCYW